MSRPGLGALLVMAAASSAFGQGVRDHTRLPRTPGTTVSPSQAIDLTLTVTAVESRPIQTWVRTAGTLDETRTTVTALLNPADAALVKVGQRARTFPIESRSQMYQARVTRVGSQGSRPSVALTLAGKGRENTTHYVIEIITERGDFLSVPNEAIIEEGATRVVYVQRGDQYQPQVIETGIQGELYTQILGGVKAGDQVVTFGSFFIDSEFKLKGSAAGP
jgi:hypothetical protein